MAWDDPNVANHKYGVNFKISDVIKKFNFNEDDNVEDYRRVNLLGETYIIPECDASRFVDNKMFLKNKSERYEFQTDHTYKSPIISDEDIDSSIFYNIILMLNSCFSNEDFINENMNYFYTPEKAELYEILTSDDTANIQQADEVDDIKTTQKKVNRMKLESKEPTVDNLAEEKLHNADIDWHSPIMIKLLQDIGFEDLKYYVRKLDKYKKD